MQQVKKVPEMFLSAYYSVRTQLMTIKLEYRPRREISPNMSLVEHPTSTVAVFQASVYDKEVNATFATQDKQLIRALKAYFTYDVIVDDTIHEFIASVSSKFHNEQIHSGHNPLTDEDDEYGLATHYRDFEDISEEDYANA